MVHIGAFYHFQTVPESDVDSIAKALESEGVRRGLRGLVIFAAEGINGTIAGSSQESVNEWLGWASDYLNFPALNSRWTTAPEFPYRHFKVRIRSEIVTLGKPEVQPLEAKSQTHLSPEKWNEVIENEDCLLIDTRNTYESRIGSFKGAIKPPLDEFQEFADYLIEAELPKDKKILIFCTGGIRCEKAIVEMHSQGFANVFQLDGGILNYLAQYPNQNYEGECFVFDTRVAVDQNLQPTVRFQLCPHCGQPADQMINCLHCETDSLICVECIKFPDKHTCSKNCAHHYSVAPEKKGRGQGASYRFGATARRNS
jgi:UPF0176 protein